MWRPTWATVNLDRLSSNIINLKAKLAPGVLMMASVKANGYGHGAVEVSKVALKSGADKLGVASVEEAVALRKSGVTADILVYGSLTELAAVAALDYQLMVTVSGLDDLLLLQRSIGKINSRRLQVHVKVDTGMGRLGIRNHSEGFELCRRIEDSGMLDLAGVFTHFSSADEMHVPEGKAYTVMQKERFESFLQGVQDEGIHIPMAHAANSAALLWGSEYHFDMVRPGIAVYGFHPAPAWQQDIGLLPVMEIHSTISRIAEMKSGEAIGYNRTYITSGQERIATVPIGYGDGIPRSLSNRGYVTVAGMAVPIVGRICMDQLMINVTGTLAAPGDTVTVYSANPESAASVQNQAKVADTIPYELVCRVTERVPRIYNSEKAW